LNLVLWLLLLSLYLVGIRGLRGKEENGLCLEVSDIAIPLGDNLGDCGGASEVEELRCERDVEI
jgi:hypothetical protein